MSLPSTSARGTLAAAALGFVVVLLDVSVVNVALDALRQEFATDVAGLQWVINAYTLVFAALLLTSGALGDRLGARRIFLAGFLVFTVASAACGLSGSEDADRRPPGPRAGGGIAGAELAGHVAAGLSRSRAAQPRGGLVGRIWRRVAGRRPGAGRNAGDAYGLAQHFSHQSAHWPDRNPSDAASRGGAWRGSSARPGLGGAGRGHPGIGRAYHGPDRSRPARLDARPGARRLVGGGRRHPGLHLDRGSRAFAHAAAGIVQGLDLRGGLPGWRDRELRLLRLDLRVQPVLPGATAALAATDGIGLPAHDHRADGRQCVGGTPDHAPGRPRADGPGAGPGGGRLWLADAGQRGRQLLAAGRADADGGQRHRPDGADHDQRHAVIGGRLPGGHCLGVLNSARQVGGMLGVAVFGYLLRDTEPQAFMRGMHLSIGIAVALLLAASALCWFRLGTERAVA